MSFPRRGGNRTGSGRKATNQSWGTPQTKSRNQLGINSFFQSSSENATSITQQSNTTNTTGTQHNDRTTPTIILPTLNNLPNFDTEEVIDENLYGRGKMVEGSKNLQYQRKAIMTSIYYNKSYKNITNFGMLWDYPATFVMNGSHNLQDCWMDFFKLKIFNWMPEAMLGKDWRPTCPNCSKKLSLNGHGNPPRLVFDQYENYWLNSPNKYICKTCQDTYRACKNEKERKQFTFISTSDEIMQQISSYYPELIDIFPCHILKVNAIDKKLMNVIVHCAVKGIGPVAMSGNIISWHELEWQKKENQWAQYVLKRLTNPSVTQQQINRGDIEKCPEYFSLKLGGCVPSGSWLVKMFCVTVQKVRSYYDSECIKRAKSSKILAIDASYKVPKWMMKWGSERIYDTLHSGTNEYNEIVMQRFSTSDNHDELGSNLESLRSLGLNPYLAFSDDPGRDESLLKLTFCKLRNSADNTNTTEILPNDLSEMKCEKNILYLFDKDKTLLMLSKFRQDIEDALKDEATTSVKVAFDTGAYDLLVLY